MLESDAFALSFAQPVAPRFRHADRTMQSYDLLQARRQHQTVHEYDPFARNE